MKEISHDIVAFIPVRGGSKGIPDKNIKELYGKPLVYWTAKAASDCQYINHVYIATDSQKITDVVCGFNLPKVTCIERDPATATDTATTESAMLDFAKKIEFNYIMLIQATSPLLTCKDLTCGVEKYFNDESDSLFSVIEQTSFLWIKDGTHVKPLNYDPLHRPRRQDYDGCLVENGAFYITRKDLLIKTGCRISGIVSSYTMPRNTYFEIDDAEDLKLIEQLMQWRQKGNNV